MARVKLAYPKIPSSENCPLAQCIAFEKYDGTNLHWVWETELGWYGFGTRRHRYDLDEMGIAEFNRAHPGLEAAPTIFLRDFAVPLVEVFREHKNYQCLPNFWELILLWECTNQTSQKNWFYLM